MSNLIHCDGPGCDKTKPIQSRLCDNAWLMVEQGDVEPPRDFCSRACLAAWSANQAGKSTTTVQVQEPAEAPDPEIHAETTRTFKQAGMTADQIELAHLHLNRMRDLGFSDHDAADLLGAASAMFGTDGITMAASYARLVQEATDRSYS